MPSWLRAGTHRSLSVLATATAAETAVFRRATTAKPMLRDRQPSTNPAVQPAESDRTITRRRTSPRSSVDTVTGGHVRREAG